MRHHVSTEDTPVHLLAPAANPGSFLVPYCTTRRECRARLRYHGHGLCANVLSHSMSSLRSDRMCRILRTYSPATTEDANTTPLTSRSGMPICSANFYRRLTASYLDPAIARARSRRPCGAPSAGRMGPACADSFCDSRCVDVPPSLPHTNTRALCARPCCNSCTGSPSVRDPQLAGPPANGSARRYGRRHHTAHIAWHQLRRPRQPEHGPRDSWNSFFYLEHWRTARRQLCHIPMTRKP